MAENVCNWIRSRKPPGTALRARNGVRLIKSAGTEDHVETSWKAFDSVWEFIEKRLKESTASKCMCFVQISSLVSF